MRHPLTWLLGPKGQRLASVVAFGLVVPAAILVGFLQALRVPLVEGSKCAR
jgi:hypothetical protein